MYCTKCGIALDEKASFCPDCGTPTRRPTFAPPAYPKLSRPREDRKIAGVCAGFARYMGVDVTLVRLVTVIMVFCPVGVGVIGYIIAWAIMPNDPLYLPAPRTESVSGHA